MWPLFACLWGSEGLGVLQKRKAATVCLAVVGKGTCVTKDGLAYNTTAGDISLSATQQQCMPW
jgi:hypothetical protein